MGQSFDENNKMPEYWVVHNNVHEDCFNIYSSEQRAKQAVQLIRERFGEDADLYDPYIMDHVQEGQAFGEDVLIDGLREKRQDMILP